MTLEFMAKVTPAARKGEKALTELAQHDDVHSRKGRGVSVPDGD